MIFLLAAQELRRLFLSPLAWSVLAVVQLILGYLFLIQVDTFVELQPQLQATEGAPGVTEVVAAPLLANAVIVLLLVAPLLTMRLISEERRGQTLSLLFSAPLSMTEVILGKYLGVMGFFLVILAITGLMPLSLLLGGSLDLGMLASGMLALALMLGSFAALGLYMSTLTAQPAIAAISTFGALLLLWILDWAAQTGGHGASSVFGYLSLLRHYEAMLKGLFSSSDVVYYLLFIFTFLVLSVRRLDADRLQH
jgi:gliding motility-associated transport system permease protein